MKIFLYLLVGAVLISGCATPNDVAYVSGEYSSAQDENMSYSVRNSRVVANEISISMDAHKDTTNTKEINAMAANFGGYVAKSDAHGIVVNIPNDNADEFLDKLGTDIGDIDKETRNLSDLTDEYAANLSHMKTLKDARRRHKALLAKSAKVEDSIDIEQELAKIDKSILNLENNIKSIETRANYTAIKIRFDNHNVTHGYGIGDIFSTPVFCGLVVVIVAIALI